MVRARTVPCIRSRWFFSLHFFICKRQYASSYCRSSNSQWQMERVFQRRAMLLLLLYHTEKLLWGDKTRALRQQWHCWPVWRHTDSISEIPCVSAVTRLVRIHVVESLVSWTSAMFLICLFVEPVWFCAAILAVELIAVLTWHVNFVVCILNNLKILLVRMIFRTELILCVPKEIHMKNRQSVSSDCEIQHVSHYSLLTKA